MKPTHFSAVQQPSRRLAGHLAASRAIAICASAAISFCLFDGTVSLFGSPPSAGSLFAAAHPASQPHAI
jgi:hypothetical protein